MELHITNVFNRKFTSKEVRLINRARKALAKLDVKFKCYEMDAWIHIVFREPLQISFRIYKSDQFWIQTFLYSKYGIPLENQLFVKNTLTVEALDHLRSCFFADEMRMWRRRNVS